MTRRADTSLELGAESNHSRYNNLSFNSWTAQIGCLCSSSSTKVHKTMLNLKISACNCRSTDGSFCAVTQDYIEKKINSLYDTNKREDALGTPSQSATLLSVMPVFFRTCWLLCRLCLAYRYHQAICFPYLLSKPGQPRVKEARLSAGPAGISCRLSNQRAGHILIDSNGQYPESRLINHFLRIRREINRHH